MNRQRGGFREIQRGFENQYNEYGKLKRDDINTLDYDTSQVWKRLQRHVISEKDKNSNQCQAVNDHS
jgi:hypothetical protein